MTKVIINVVNKHHRAQGEYIGRGSPLGNPYSHMKGTKALYLVRNRQEAVEKYHDWLKERLEDRSNHAVVGELHRLMQIALREGELNLLCFCAPRACHGDVVKQVLEVMIERFYQEESK